MRPEPQVCLLCGYEEGAPGEVAPAIVRWVEPHRGSSFGATYRCRERAGCRARVEARGKPWEVWDAGSPMPQYDTKPDVGQRLPASEPTDTASPAPAHEPEPEPGEQLLEVFG